MRKAGCCWLSTSFITWVPSIDLRTHSNSIIRRCRKKMKRVERRGTLESQQILLQQQQAAQQAALQRGTTFSALSSSQSSNGGVAGLQRSDTTILTSQQTGTQVPSQFNLYSSISQSRSSASSSAPLRDRTSSQQQHQTTTTTTQGTSSSGALGGPGSGGAAGSGGSASVTTATATGAAAGGRHNSQHMSSSAAHLQQHQPSPGPSSIQQGGGVNDNTKHNSVAYERGNGHGFSNGYSRQGQQHQQSPQQHRHDQHSQHYPQQQQQQYSSATTTGSSPFPSSPAYQNQSGNNRSRVNGGDGDGLGPSGNDLSSRGAPSLKGGRNSIYQKQLQSRAGAKKGVSSRSKDMDVDDDGDFLNGDNRRSDAYNDGGNAGDDRDDPDMELLAAANAAGSRSNGRNGSGINKIRDVARGRGQLQDRSGPSQSRSDTDLDLDADAEVDGEASGDNDGDVEAELGAEVDGIVFPGRDRKTDGRRRPKGRGYDEEVDRMLVDGADNEGDGEGEGEDEIDEIDDADADILSTIMDDDDESSRRGTGGNTSSSSTGRSGTSHSSNGNATVPPRSAGAHSKRAGWKATTSSLRYSQTVAPTRDPLHGRHGRGFSNEDDIEDDEDEDDELNELVASAMPPNSKHSSVTAVGHLNGKKSSSVSTSASTTASRTRSTGSGSASGGTSGSAQTNISSSRNSNSSNASGGEPEPEVEGDGEADADADADAEAEVDLADADGEVDGGEDVAMGEKRGMMLSGPGRAAVVAGRSGDVDADLLDAVDASEVVPK